MKLWRENLRLGKGFIFTTLLVSQFFLSACNHDDVIVQEAKSYSDPFKSEIAEKEIYSTRSQLTSTENLSTTKEVLKPSFVDKDLSETYITPEALSKQLKHPVNDFTNSLSTAELTYLNEKLREIYEEGLLQIGIVVVATTQDTPIFDYSMKVAKSWQLGSSENNNGLLILMALNDRQIYILTGLDIEDELTDERVASVIDKDMTPHFQKVNYVTGLSAGIDSLVDSIRMSH